MKKIKKVLVSLVMIAAVMGLTACDSAVSSGSENDSQATREVADTLSTAQPTPTDINFSLERYNLTKRAYWVNGQREKAAALVCRVEKPLGYIVLFTSSGSVVGRFVVDGKVSSLNSFLTPDSEYFELVNGGSSYTHKNRWLADVDGSYGENDSGIFFFDVQGNYIEWTGTYLYTDIPMQISDPILSFDVSYDTAG